MVQATEGTKDSDTTEVVTTPHVKSGPSFLLNVFVVCFSQ